jgi:hypothetical protein
VALTPDEAIGRARVALGQPEAEGRALPVDRLDRPGVRYTLVILGSRAGSSGVATLDERGELMSSASLPGREPHLPVDEAGARGLAGAAGDAPARLVWAPCAQSRSPIYPLWEVRVGDGVRYVDQQRRVWSRLGPAGPGGG